MTVMDNFLVLEGLDGSGTTTQLELLERRLRETGRPYHCTSEPTGGSVGLLIRRALRGELALDHRTIAFLFAADRNEHLHAGEGRVLDRLRQGQLVVTDRYIFSSLAYQGLPCGAEFVHTLNGGFPLPSDVVFLDTPVEVSQERLSARSARDIFDDGELQSRIRELYFEAFARYETSEMRVHILDGTAPVEEVAREIWKVVLRLPIMGA
jgi:dTMP kinase